MGEERLSGTVAGCATGVVGCLMFLEWGLGLVLHIWTVIIAWELAGGLAAFLAFTFPFLSEIIVGWTAFKMHGIASVYVLLLIGWCLVCGAKWVGAFILSAKD